MCCFGILHYECLICGHKFKWETGDVIIVFPKCPKCGSVKIRFIKPHANHNP